MTTRGSAGRRGAALVLVLVLVALIAAATGKDPLADRQYHIGRVRASDAWELTKGGGEIIAVLDTGVDASHPDLKGRLVPGVDLVDRGTPPDDRNGHGTFVAGVAVANLRNAEGGRGVAPRAMVMPVRVLDDEGMGRSDVVAEGIRWAARNGAAVINLSLVDVAGDERPPTALITTDVELAIRQAALDGVVVVGAAGNEGSSSTPYSRDLPAIVVGASTRRDAVWTHSNRDNRTLFAPGVAIVSTYVGDPYAVADGTSFAAPIVSAAAAMLIHRGMDGDEVRDRLAATARPIGAGRGRVDVAAALGIAPRVRSTPKPQPSPSAQAQQRRRQPEPVTRPSPVEPATTQRGEAATQPPAVAAVEPEPEVTRTDPPPTAPPAEQPSPLDEPTAAAPVDVAAPDIPEPPAQRPLWPVVLAGVLLFVLTVALAGYATARRAGGSA